MRGRLLFVITEDWFFRSHFLPVADAARAAGFELFIACRCGAAQADLEARGLTVLPLDGLRSHVSIASAWREATMIRRFARAHRIDLVHFIALRPILIGFALAATRPAWRSVYALTGRGYLGVGEGFRARLMRAALRTIAPLAAGGKSWLLFENRDDPAFLGLDPATARNITILGGAGVDPEALRPEPLPEGDALRVAFVGRMLRFKGVGDAVEAVGLARAEGHRITLSLYGEPDPDNPASIPRAELEAWSRLDGVAWHGRASDVREVWADHHVCIQPSHAGEGLPRALLEAAACGRAIVTTDTPGCRDFVRDGVDGLIVPPQRSDLLSAALIRLSKDAGLVANLAAAARRRVLDGFTTRDVTGRIIAAYESLLDGRVG